MKRKCALLIYATTVLLSTHASAQVYTMDWGTSFSPVWANGNTSRTAYNIGGSGVNASVSLSKTGGVYPVYYGVSTPTVNNTLIWMPNSPKHLSVVLDYSTNTQYTTITVTFSNLVCNVFFRIGDIDRNDPDDLNYLDDLIISGLAGVTARTPTITKYDATTDPDFLVISGNRVTVNPAAYRADNTATTSSDQRGTINVSFGAQFINRISIRYQNAAGTQVDPTVQYIVLSNISFSMIPFPVQLLSFDGKTAGSSAQLTWNTTAESDFSHFELERSTDGTSYSEAARILATGTSTGSTQQYSFTDHKLAAGKYYYRLRMVDQDGSHQYSEVVKVNIGPNAGTVSRVYPTLFSSHFTVEAFTASTGRLQVQVTGLSGQSLLQKDYTASAGRNIFRIEELEELPPGPYLVSIKTESGSTYHSIIKQ